MQAYEQIGAIPQWGFMNSVNGVMIGDSAPAIVAEFYAFGARSADDGTLLSYLVKQATTENHMRRQTKTYDKIGYVPELPSHTVEYTQQDFALSRLAYALGDKASGDFFTRRSTYWKNIFDPTTGLLAPRRLDGTFVPVTPETRQGYVEGSAAQYRFQVPADRPALAALLGGNDRTNALLDDLFKGFGGQTPTTALLTNEFALGQPWFYNWTRKPSRTQEVVHRWLATTYANDCCTFRNNDDLGTMSANFVWAALGMYPVAAGSADVALNSPMFTRSVIHLPNGRTLTFNAPQASNSNYYIQSLAVNGAATSRNWLPASVFTNGATVNFTLGAAPSTWGSGPNDGPPYYDNDGKPALPEGGSP
jgi:predicted alpha-1,2-mannosidase